MNENEIKVSIVIPAKNREQTIERAIESVLSQKGDFVLEIIVVDDASTDKSKEIVVNLQSKYQNLFLIENSESVGGAVARNIGAKIATGKYIAFLDSDDEWLENHLREKIGLIYSNGAQGCFGAFHIIRNNKIMPMIFPEFKGVSISKYIFENGGDARTSTFVFKRDAFMKIMFDNELGKHQDWDIAIRFDIEFSMVFDTKKNVNVYVDGGNRMSNKNNYNASNYFQEKHKNILTSQSLYIFKLNLCFNAFRTEGNSKNFKSEMKELRKFAEKEDVHHKLKFTLLNNVFLRALLPIMFYVQQKIS